MFLLPLGDLLSQRFPLHLPLCAFLSQLTQFGLKTNHLEFRSTKKPLNLAQSFRLATFLFHLAGLVLADAVLKLSQLALQDIVGFTHRCESLCEGVLGERFRREGVPKTHNLLFEVSNTRERRLNALQLALDLIELLLQLCPLIFCLTLNHCYKHQSAVEWCQ